MHTAATLLLPLAAEKSKVPFYVAGGLLASWAVIVSVLLGLRKPAFPDSLGGQRAVIAITAVLVLGAVSMAVATSSSPAKASAAGAGPRRSNTTSRSPKEARCSAPRRRSPAAPALSR